MTVITIVVGIVLLLGALGVLAFALSWLLSVLSGSQVVHTSPVVFPYIRKLARLAPGERFVELGCGRGDLCLSIAEQTGARVVGVDINPLLIAYARWRARANPDITFVIGNVYHAPIRDAGVIYCYLLPPMLKRLVDRFQAELRPGTRVISYAFPLPGVQPTQTIPRSPKMAALYCYEFWPQIH